MELINIFILTVIFVAIIMCFGLLYTLLRGVTCRNIQVTFGSKVFMVLSCIGVPVHELSHLIACLIFFHIPTKVVLFSPKMWRETGVLGKVENSYNRRRLYQQAGNFIIGVAPVLGGALVSFLIIRFVLNMDVAFSLNALSVNTIIDLIRSIFTDIIGIFTLSNMSSPIFWILLFALINIFLHVSLSRADFKGAWVGVIFFIILIPIIALICNWGGIDYSTYANVLYNIDCWFVYVLMFGIVIDVIMLVVSSISRLVKALIGAGGNGRYKRKSQRIAKRQGVYANTGNLSKNAASMKKRAKKIPLKNANKDMTPL